LSPALLLARRRWPIVWWLPAARFGWWGLPVAWRWCLLDRAAGQGAALYVIGVEVVPGVWGKGSSARWGGRQRGGRDSGQGDDGGVAFDRGEFQAG
jgi:hypothetical protein